MKRLLAPLTLLLVLALGACDAHTGGWSKHDVGTLFGAGLGALAGSQIGSGTGQLAAVAIGTLLGAFLGSEVGSSLDRADRVYAEQVAYRALERGRAGVSQSWYNPNNGHGGTFTPTRTLRTQLGYYCREYQVTVIVAGRQAEAYGTACRQSDGSWQISN